MAVARGDGNGTSDANELKLETVYHVGDLDQSREPPKVSMEGSGLSISLHPEDWQRIADLDGDVYELENTEASFYDAKVDGQPREEAIQWCIGNDYITVTQKWRVTYEPVGRPVEYIIFDDREEAKAEAEALVDAEVDVTSTFELGEKGREYWKDAFTSSPDDADSVIVEGLIPVWYAEGHGFDGVWWDEKYEPSQYSAPRGVIFQSSLDDWERSIVEE